MRVMVMVRSTASAEAGKMPSEKLMADMQKFNEELMEAGLLRAGEGLRPSRDGVRVHISDSNHSVTDGPFADTKELIAGFWLWEVDSMEQAIEWGKRCPKPMPEDSAIEIRPLYEMSDFEESDPTLEVSRREQQLAQQLAMRNSMVQPYLFYGGRCEEALEFYSHAVGAKVLSLLRFRDNPQPPPAGTLPDGFESKIMHASFRVGEMTLMASDGCSEQSQFAGFRLVLTVASLADADRAFAALAEGGNVDMPLAATFWSPRYGMLTDKFGVGWMVMVAATEAAGDTPA